YERPSPAGRCSADSDRDDRRHRWFGRLLRHTGHEPADRLPAVAVFEARERFGKQLHRIEWSRVDVKGRARNRVSKTAWDFHAALRQEGLQEIRDLTDRRRA